MDNSSYTFSDGDVFGINIDTWGEDEHKCWSDWMQYLFSKGIFNEDGTWTMPKWAVDRWKNQMNTPYECLSIEEQASDKDVVLRYHGKYLKFLLGLVNEYSKQNFALFEKAMELYRFVYEHGDRTFLAHARELYSFKDGISKIFVGLGKEQNGR